MTTRISASRSTTLAAVAPSIMPEVDLTSRRQMLMRLAGLGLVAAGGPALMPDTAEAKQKAKSRGRDRRTKQRRKGDAPSTQERNKGGDQPTPEREGKLHAQAAVRNPIVCHPIANNRAPLFTVKSDGSGYVVVRVSGRILFTNEHVLLMKNGRRYHVACEIWEADPNPHDYCFTFTTYSRHLFPANRNAPPRTVHFFFEQTILSDKLDHDVDDGPFDSDDDVDDPYGLVRLYTLGPGSTSWQGLTSTKTNEVPGRY